MLPFLNATQPMVLVAFLLALKKLNLKVKLHLILFVILCISLFNELLSFIFLLCNISIGLLTSITAFIHNALWITLLLHVTSLKKESNIIIYILYGCVNMLFFEGLVYFNCNTFVTGSIIYLFFFLQSTYINLKKENFDFFLAKEYKLIFSPLLFFISFSLIFAFKSRDLRSTIIFLDINLYKLIGTFVNLIYYSFITTYLLQIKTDEK